MTQERIPHAGAGIMHGCRKDTSVWKLRDPQIGAPLLEPHVVVLVLAKSSNHAVFAERTELEVAGERAKPKRSPPGVHEEPALRVIGEGGG
jgi:hypothetical protein